MAGKKMFGDMEILDKCIDEANRAARLNELHIDFAERTIDMEQHHDSLVKDESIKRMEELREDSKLYAQKYRWTAKFLQDYRCSLTAKKEK